MTNSTHDYFARDYVEARTAFLARAGRCGARLRRHELTARGPNNEMLTIDVAYLGAATPTRLFIAISGTHGAEGFAGSAIQQRWLDGVDPAGMPPGTGVLLVHALNPHGFAWIRRTNENNVDLNRNALDRFPGPSNEPYGRLDCWLNPASPPGALDLFWMQAGQSLLTIGFAGMKQAIAGGQYEFPKGLFYGGAQREASIAYLRDTLLAPEFANVERVVAIDIHTGLGERATYKLLVDLPEESPPYRELQQWYGVDHLAGNRPEHSIAYHVSGGVTGLIERCFPNAAVYPGVLEFGTVALPRMIFRLRRENRAYFYAGHDSKLYAQARAALLDAFCPGDTAWRGQILEQGTRVLRQAQRLTTQA